MSTFMLFGADFQPYNGPKFRKIEKAREAAAKATQPVIIRERVDLGRRGTGWRNVDCDFIRLVPQAVTQEAAR